MSYGGGVSCAGGVGQKTVNVFPEVGNAVDGQPHWYVIGGIGLYHGPTPVIHFVCAELQASSLATSTGCWSTEASCCPTVGRRR